MTTGHKVELTAHLTERRFREHWKRTKGKEHERFAQVAHALEHGIPHGHVWAERRLGELLAEAVNHKGGNCP